MIVFGTGSGLDYEVMPKPNGWFSTTLIASEGYQPRFRIIEAFSHLTLIVVQEPVDVKVVRT